MSPARSIDLVDVAAKRLREAGYKDADVKRLADVSDGGIAVRRVPATTTGTYYDGTRNVSYLFQVAVARESERQAIDECCDIAELLTHADLASENGTYRLTSTEVYTDPQELELTDSGITVWECRFKAIITTKGRTTL
ncbi:MAG: minor capsid protein [Gordonibacter sp.]|uniref:phage tail terminator protein n=1 Tax=Gordonibacter sp. TaxID=1968902 RepID=UPI002FCA59E3